MVKGISRRVVVVRPPDSAVYEQAIFIMRDAAPPARDTLREACEIAQKYAGVTRVRQYRRRRWTTPQLVLAMIGSAGMVGIIWFITGLLC